MYNTFEEAKAGSLAQFKHTVDINVKHWATTAKKPITKQLAWSMVTDTSLWHLHDEHLTEAAAYLFDSFIKNYYPVCRDEERNDATDWEEVNEISSGRASVRINNRYGMDAEEYARTLHHNQSEFV